MAASLFSNFIKLGIKRAILRPWLCFKPGEETNNFIYPALL